MPPPWVAGRHQHVSQTCPEKPLLSPVPLASASSQAGKRTVLPLLQPPPEENQARSTADRLSEGEEGGGRRALIKEVTSKPGNL